MQLIWEVLSVKKNVGVSLFTASVNTRWGRWNSCNASWLFQRTPSAPFTTSRRIAIYRQNCNVTYVTHVSITLSKLCHFGGHVVKDAMAGQKVFVGKAKISIQIYENILLLCGFASST